MAGYLLGPSMRIDRSRSSSGRMQRHAGRQRGQTRNEDAWRQDSFIPERAVGPDHGMRASPRQSAQPGTEGSPGKSESSAGRCAPIGASQRGRAPPVPCRKPLAGDQGKARGREGVPAQRAYAARPSRTGSGSLLPLRPCPSGAFLRLHALREALVNTLIFPPPQYCTREAQGEKRTSMRIRQFPRGSTHGAEWARRQCGFTWRAMKTSCAPQ
jgi:hypothetical protein